MDGGVGRGGRIQGTCVGVCCGVWRMLEEEEEEDEKYAKSSMSKGEEEGVEEEECDKGRTMSVRRDCCRFSGCILDPFESIE